MTNILPDYTGLIVSGLVYQYTTVKDTADDMVVTVQNENLAGDGYIFRSVDDWSGLPGNSINKVIPIPAVLGSAFGDGSISWSGKGNVIDANVVYSYQYDLCFDPQADPTCPDYIKPIPELPVIVVSDPLQDEFIRAEMEKKAALEDEEEEAERLKKKKERKGKKRLEILLGSINSTLLSAQAQAQADLLLAMNAGIEVYYTSIPGGRYDETVSYADTQLPPNVNARRVSFAQQLLHEKMIKSQYSNLISQP